MVSDGFSERVRGQAQKAEADSGKSRVGQRPGKVLRLAASDLVVATQHNAAVSTIQETKHHAYFCAY